jgi:hypothetical protein
MLLACDPGVRGCGLALFDEKSQRFTLGMWVSTEKLPRTKNLLQGVKVLALERQYLPKTHPRPMNIVELAFAAGRVAGIWAECRLVELPPSTWKGSVPKRIMLDRIRSRLDADEITLTVGLNEHVMDAIGIGLFALGRLKGRIT